MSRVIDKSQYTICREKTTATIRSSEGLNQFEKEALENTLKRHKISFRELGKH
ncbi:MAG: hypothetical protein JW931_00020 [Methanomicrobiaceae archaeon]|nr:hypothetical protein [Methanomicrobiaceae archaeon]